MQRCSNSNDTLRNIDQYLAAILGLVRYDQLSIYDENISSAVLKKYRRSGLG